MGARTIMPLTLETHRGITTKPIYFINPLRTQWGLVHVIKKITITGEEKTLAMVYGKKLSKELLKKCICYGKNSL